MAATPQPYVLIAMTTQERGEGLRGVVTDVGLDATLFSDVEELLYHTRVSVPSALILEHGLAAKVQQLDLVALLRRRKALADVPFVYLGPADPQTQAAVVGSGADVYLTASQKAIGLPAGIALLVKQAAALSLGE